MRCITYASHLFFWTVMLSTAASGSWLLTYWARPRVRRKARAGLEGHLGGVEWFSKSGRVGFARKICYSSQMGVENCYSLTVSTSANRGFQLSFPSLYGH